MQKNTLSVLIFSLFLSLAIPLTFVWAHGGEDHGGPTQAPVMPGEKEHALLVKTKTAEILLKHGELKAGQASLLRVFVTDFKTNAPIGGERLRISFKEEKTKEPAEELLMSSSPTLGVYEVIPTFAKPGNYTALIHLSGDSLETQVNVPGLSVTK